MRLGWGQLPPLCPSACARGSQGLAGVMVLLCAPRAGSSACASLQGCEDLSAPLLSLWKAFLLPLLTTTRNLLGCAVSPESSLCVEPGWEGMLLEGLSQPPEIDSQGLSGPAAPRDWLNVTSCRRDTVWAGSCPPRALLESGITPGISLLGDLLMSRGSSVSETSGLFPKQK